jgi:cytidine deaminase
MAVMPEEVMRDAPHDVSTVNVFKRLGVAAWKVRDNAYILGKTKVGCALLTAEGEMFVGCNVEHRFRSHDVHAEVNAISTMIANGQQRIEYVLVAADRNNFTPCGACMDWIMQFAAERCLVAFQASPGAEPTIYTAQQLMPYYPH